MIFIENTPQIGNDLVRDKPVKTNCQPSTDRQKRILLVEDNDLNLILLADALELAGYLVIASRRGSEAIELARQHAPDLILMDIRLPDISGIEAVRRLKADERLRAIPIIAVTALAMSGDREGILTSGCDDYLSKPFKIAELLQLVERYAQPR